MSDTNDSFLREVKEEVRREQLAKLFDKYGVLALAVVGVLIVSIAGWQWYRAYTIDIAQKSGARMAVAQRLMLSQDDKDKAAAVEELERLARDGAGAYPALARLQLVGRYMDTGKTAEAKAALEAVVADPKAPPLLKSYAQLQLAGLDAGGGDWTELKNRLTPLMSEDAAWRYSARELLAAAAVKSGRPDDARQILSELLADSKAPASIRQRAEMMMSMVAPAPVDATAGADTKKSEASGTDGSKAAPAAQKGAN